MAANKVKYGLKNVHYAVATISDQDHSATYAEPVAIPGAVTLTMSAEGGETKFRADNINYWIGQSNAGYSGDLEIALVPRSFKIDVLGMVESNGVLIEDVSAKTVPFALTFQFEGDQHETRHVLYNCAASRPQVNGSTTQETIEPQTETISMSSSSIYNAALDKEIAKASVENDGDQATIYAGWNTAIWQPTSTSAGGNEQSQDPEPTEP